MAGLPIGPRIRRPFATSVSTPDGQGRRATRVSQYFDASLGHPPRSNIHIRRYRNPLFGCEDQGTSPSVWMTTIIPSSRF